MQLPPLTGLSLSEIDAALHQLDVSPDAARKLTYWLYRRQASQFSMMNTLKKSDLGKIGQYFSEGVIYPVTYAESSDGTRKYLFKFAQNRCVEAALIPAKKGSTLCVSSQAGCRMGCRFCNTATNGYKGQLTAQEIVTQLSGIPEAADVNHVVVMGMGEPLDNIDAVLKGLEIFSAEWGFSIARRNITLSTVGLTPGLQYFTENTQYNLAISLHSPFERERQMLMPAERFSPAEGVIAYLKQYQFKKPRRLTVEYLVLQGINHSELHVEALARMLKGLKCHVNLIPFNPFPGSEFNKPTDLEVSVFRNRLDELGLMATIRNSRGADIDAACGMLAAKESRV